MSARRSRSGVFEPQDWRQLKVFAWFLLLINLCIVGIGALLSRSLEYSEDGRVLVLAVAALVNGTFLAIVGGNVVIALAARWLARSAPGHLDHRIAEACACEQTSRRLVPRRSRKHDLRDAPGRHRSEGRVE